MSELFCVPYWIGFVLPFLLAFLAGYLFFDAIENISKWIKKREKVKRK